MLNANNHRCHFIFYAHLYKQKVEYLKQMTLLFIFADKAINK